MWKKILLKAVTSIIQEILKGLATDVIDQRVVTLNKVHQDNKRTGLYAKDPNQYLLMKTKIEGLKEVSDVIISATEK